jgi:hypothetical protein
LINLTHLYQTGLVETFHMEPIENNISELEVVTVTDLGAEEFTPPSNSLLTGPYAPVFMQVLPPRSEFTDSIPLHWATMEGTPEVSRLGAIVTPTSDNRYQWDISLNLDSLLTYRNQILLY